MDKSRRQFIESVASTAAAGLIAPLAGCDTPPTGPTSVEQIQFTSEHARIIRTDILKRLKISDATTTNEIARLLFSIQENKVPDTLDMNGPLMRVYMEFYANNIPDMLKNYGITKISNDVLVKKRETLLNSRAFKVSFIRYCAKHFGRNPLLEVPLSSLYTLQPGALMVDPKMPQTKQSEVFRTRAGWIQGLQTAPLNELEKLADRIKIAGRFEVGTVTGFVLEDLIVTVQSR